MTTVRPFLMFQGDAKAAMNLYVSLFPESEVLDLVLYGPGEPGPEGSVKKGTYRLAARGTSLDLPPERAEFARDAAPEIAKFWWLGKAHLAAVNASSKPAVYMNGGREWTGQRVSYEERATSQDGVISSTCDVTLFLSPQIRGSGIVGLVERDRAAPAQNWQRRELTVIGYGPKERVDYGVAPEKFLEDWRSRSASSRIRPSESTSVGVWLIHARIDPRSQRSDDRLGGKGPWPSSVS